MLILFSLIKHETVTRKIQDSRRIQKSIKVKSWESKRIAQSHCTKQHALFFQRIYLIWGRAHSEGSLYCYDLFYQFLNYLERLEGRGGEKKEVETETKQEAGQVITVSYSHGSLLQIYTKSQRFCALAKDSKGIQCCRSKDALCAYLLSNCTA